MATLKQDPLWMRIVVELVLRVIYFVMGFLALPVIGIVVRIRPRRLFSTHAVTTGHSNALVLFFGICLLLGIAAMLFGPLLHKQEVERGRGSLEEIKRNSIFRRKDNR